MDDPRVTATCPHAVRIDPGHGSPVADTHSDTPRLSLIAYERHEGMDGILFRMSPRRFWMDRTPNRYAYRCLPLVVANQAGWVIRNPITFSAMWTGGPRADDVQLIIAPGQRCWGGLPPETIVVSHFGEAILTFHLPFLFRTSEDYNLWVKGPANSFKDGIQALEGMIETDWSHAPFTMNWKLTRPYHTITFQEGEPICQLVPYPRGLLERFDPEIRPMASDADLSAAFARWHAERGQFLRDLDDPTTEAHHQEWQKDYCLGRQGTGDKFTRHQTALQLKDFVRADPRAGAPAR
jgi:hypothetical protein